MTSQTSNSSSTSVLAMIPNLRAILMGTYTFCLAFVAILGGFLDPTGRLYMWFARRMWGKVVLGLGGVRVTETGGEDLDPKQPYVICTNHASQLDIPSIFGALPIPIRFLAKRSLFYIPIFGWSMWLARFIPVDRSRSRKARESIDKVAQKIKTGPSLMVFPEGTRSPDGKIHKFKSGAFVMAIKAGVPVLPVAIRGSYDLLPKGTTRVKSGTINIVIGAPIPTDGLAMTDKESLRRRVQEAVEKMCETGEPSVL